VFSELRRTRPPNGRTGHLQSFSPAFPFWQIDHRQCMMIKLMKSDKIAHDADWT